MLLVLTTALLCATAFSQQYTVNDLGTFGGSSPLTNPTSINNSGQVAGTVYSSDYSVLNGFRTAANSAINPLTDGLGALPGQGCSVVNNNSINNSGQVTGTSQSCTYSNPSHAFRADPGNATLVDLGVRSGVSGPYPADSYATGINASGKVTGGAMEYLNIFCFNIISSRAFRTAANGTVPSGDDLGTLLAYSCRSSVGFGINTSGQVVGYSAFGNILNPSQHAFLATPGSAMQDLGGLGGPGFFGSPGPNATAWAINDSGQVVGASTYVHSATVPDTAQHAFLTTATASSMTDLGTLGGTFSSAASINGPGQIVGYATTAGDSAVHAFIYQSGVMTDLNTRIPANSGWVLQSAQSINDIGQIVGTGTLNGVPRGFRLDPPANMGVSNLLAELSVPALALSSGEIQSLGATPQAALNSIQQSNAKSAKGQLVAFINQIQALVNSGRLDAQDAASLTAAAKNILVSL